MTFCKEIYATFRHWKAERNRVLKLCKCKARAILKVAGIETHHSNNDDRTAKGSSPVWLFVFHELRIIRQIFPQEAYHSRWDSWKYIQICMVLNKAQHSQNTKLQTGEEPWAIWLGELLSDFIELYTRSITQWNATLFALWSYSPG